jgi:citrate lyase beta subunit
MSKVDLNRFSQQIERLELANRAASADALSSSPKHAFHQPVHVMYGGAHLFTEKTFEKIAKLSIEAFRFAAPNASALNARCGQGWSGEFANEIFKRVEAKILSAPLEDYRIDFEDGYGVRSDDEEDAHAVSTARVVVATANDQYTPKNIGIRLKPLSTSGMRRSLKTLALFVESFSRERKQHLPGPKHLIVTLPKVTNAEQVATLVEILDGYEKDLHLGHSFFSIELIIESPEAFLGRDGTIPLASFMHAAAGRCRSLHFGVYDFTSSIGIGSAGQSVDHLACDFARMWIQLGAALAPNVTVSDGIISRLPILPKELNEESRSQFDSAWLYNYQQMTRSLANGYYQGWDLHPCQLPIRHIANHVYVLRELEGAAARLKAFAAKSAQASHVGGVFDDRASVLGLLNFFDRAIASGVVSSQEIAAAGVDLPAVRKSI